MSAPDPTCSCIILWPGKMGILFRAFGSQPESCFWWATGNPCVVANMKPENSSQPCGHFETPTPSYLLMAHSQAFLRRFQEVPNRGPSIAYRVAHRFGHRLCNYLHICINWLTYIFYNSDWKDLVNALYQLWAICYYICNIHFVNCMSCIWSCDHVPYEIIKHLAPNVCLFIFEPWVWNTS